MASRLGCSIGGEGEVNRNNSRIHLGEREKAGCKGERERSSDGRRL